MAIGGMLRKGQGFRAGPAAVLECAKHVNAVAAHARAADPSLMAVKGSPPRMDRPVLY